jgi:hypothetical protein
VLSGAASPEDCSPSSTATCFFFRAIFPLNSNLDK